MPLAQTDLAASAARAWPAFVLVAGLLVLGLVAERGGLFGWAGARLERLPGPPVVLGVGCLAVVALVTAVLNLDTAVVFVTPVVVHAVRRRGLDPRPVAYATLVMVNASSLLLPGANLTNLVVRGDDPIGGGRWLAEIAPAGLAAAVLSAAVLLARDAPAWRTAAVGVGPSRPDERGAGARDPDRDRDRGVVEGAHVEGSSARPPAAAVTANPGRPTLVAVLSTITAGVLIVALPEPALPVLAVALVALACELPRRRLSVAEAVHAVGPAVLGGLLLLVVALGWLARVWDGPASLVSDAGPLASATVAAVAAVLVNNLPAAALLTAGHPAHPEAVLVGLNLGPNLVVTGSLASWLWWRTCRDAGVPVTLRGLASRAPLAAVPTIVVAALLVGG